MQQNVRGITDTSDAHHFAHMIAAHGYLYAVEGQPLTVKNDSTLYRVQLRSNWLSYNPDPDNIEYGEYPLFLCVSLTEQLPGVVVQKLTYRVFGPAFSRLPYRGLPACTCITH